MKIKLTRSQRKIVTSSKDIAPIIIDYLRKEVDFIDRMKEHLFVVGLLSSNEISYIEVCSVGTLKATIVSPQEVFRRAIRHGGIASIILLHNHPSQCRKISRQDEIITKKMVEAGKMLDISVLDHIVVTTRRSWISMSDEGLMNV